ncbi:hypothetical protein AS361_05775 [Myroides marinus]|nr:hypothetical protein AS361_05775 [Myroides marinus]
MVKAIYIKYKLRVSDNKYAVAGLPKKLKFINKGLKSSAAFIVFKKSRQEVSSKDNKAYYKTFKLEIG